MAVVNLSLAAVTNSDLMSTHHRPRSDKTINDFINSSLTLTPLESTTMRPADSWTGHCWSGGSMQVTVDRARGGQNVTNSHQNESQFGSDETGTFRSVNKLTTGQLCSFQVQSDNTNPNQWNNFDDMFSRFDSTSERDSRTHCDSLCRAIQHRAGKTDESAAANIYLLHYKGT